MTTGFQTFQQSQSSPVTERFKGVVITGQSKRTQRRTFYLGEHSWHQRCIAFDKIVEANALARQTIAALAGQLIAEGIFPQPVTDKDDKPYPRAEEALAAVEKLNEQIHIKKLLFESCKAVAKYGSCFWEKTWQPSFNVRMIPRQECVEPALTDENGEVVKWRQVINGVEEASWTAEEIVPLHFDVTSNSWPYGTSLLLGTDEMFDIQRQLIANINSYTEKQAWPYELLQLGDRDNPLSETELTDAKAQWKNRQVGEGILSTVPSDLKQGGTGGAPIRDLTGVLQFVKDEIQDACIMPAMSKLYNSTEASAKVLTSYAMSCLVKPMQEIIRIHLQEDVYKPYLEDLGFSVKTCPTLLFESPDSQKREEMEFWTGMVNAGICPPLVAAREFGWEDEWLKEQERKKKEQELMFKQKQAQGQQDEEDEGDGKQWIVKERVTGKRHTHIHEEDEEGRWVTINGVHVLIKQGESAADAFKRTTGKDLDGEKGKDLKAPDDQVTSGESKVEVAFRDGKKIEVTSNILTPEEIQDWAHDLMSTDKNNEEAAKVLNDSERQELQKQIIQNKKRPKWQGYTPEGSSQSP